MGAQLKKRLFKTLEEYRVHGKEGNGKRKRKAESGNGRRKRKTEMENGNISAI